MAEKSLYEVQDKRAGKEDIVLNDNDRRDELQDMMEVSFYETSEEDKTELLPYLAQRFQEMDDSRPDELWGARIDQYNATLIEHEDGTASVNLPIEMTTIRNKLADLQSQKSVVDFLPVSSDDIHKRELLNDIWDFVWVEGDTDKELTKLWYSALIFGSGWWMEGLHKEVYTRYVPKQVGEKIVGEAKRQTKSWIMGKALDIRDVWVDPVPEIEDAVDCYIAEREMSFDGIMALTHDPNYDKDAILAFLSERGPSNTSISANEQSTFQTHEEIHTSAYTKYTLLHYYNKEKGMYIVTEPTFSFVFRKGVNPYPHGELPVSLLIDHPRPLELYGIGECEILESTKYERNTIRNQITDYARMSNTLTLAVGENVTFENEEIIGGVARVWNFTGNLGDAQYLKPPSQDSSLFNLDELLRNDATVWTGIDNNALSGSPTKTAFEARLQEQTKLKGVGVTLRQFDYFLTRMARQRLANIQFWLPYTTGKKMAQHSVEDSAYKQGTRVLALQDRKMEDIMGVNTKGNPEKKGIRLQKKEGHIEFLELTPKMIQGQFDVMVTTPTTTPVLRELDRQDMQEVFTNLLNLAQTPEGAQLLKEFDFNAYYRDLISEKGFDPDKYMKTATPQQKKQELRAEVLGDVPRPSKPPMLGKEPQNPFQPQPMGPQPTMLP